MEAGAVERTGGADWGAIQAAYEAGVEGVAAIAAQHGVSEGAIARRRRAEGWRLRKPELSLKMRQAGQARSRLSRRLKRMITQEIKTLQGLLAQPGMDDERRLKRIQATATALAKVLDLERKERPAEIHPAATLRALDAAALEIIAERLERMALDSPPPPRDAAPCDAGAVAA